MTMRLVRSFLARFRRIDYIQSQVTRTQEALGRIELRQTQSARTLRDAEFSVFSQWGEDGIIQFLLRHVPIENKVFVEFGVQDYVESNTRFLAANDRWSGLVIDGSVDNVERIRKSDFFWRSDINAVCAFITRDNINDLIRSAGTSGDIGLLSVDIDGNDYWVWEAIDVVSPRIVVVEYNSRFGAERAVTVPYDPAFARAAAHHSMIYYGASLPALAALGQRKGYALVGCNSAGNNAFFVRKDCQGALPALTPAAAFVASRFREARNAAGELAFLTAQEERRCWRHCLSSMSAHDGGADRSCHRRRRVHRSSCRAARMLRLTPMSWGSGTMRRGVYRHRTSICHNGGAPVSHMRSCDRSTCDPTSSCTAPGTVSLRRRSPIQRTRCDETSRLPGRSLISPASSCGRRMW